jgi:hypothetical protein
MHYLMDRPLADEVMRERDEIIRKADRAKDQQAKGPDPGIRGVA